VTLALFFYKSLVLASNILASALALAIKSLITTLSTAYRPLEGTAVYCERHVCVEYVVLYSRNGALPVERWHIKSVGRDTRTSIGVVNSTGDYFFRVQARNSHGFGPKSDVVRFRVMPPSSELGMCLIIFAIGSKSLSWKYSMGQKTVFTPSAIIPQKVNRSYGWNLE